MSDKGVDISYGLLQVHLKIANKLVTHVLDTCATRIHYVATNPCS